MNGLQSDSIAEDSSSPSTSVLILRLGYQQSTSKRAEVTNADKG